MALDPSIYDEFMFMNMKSILDESLHEANRSAKSVNGILETALSGNITNQQAANANNAANLQRMDVTEAAAVSSVIRNDLAPQVASMGLALRAFVDGLKAGSPEQQ